ncbi:MAG: site-specific integrase [Propionicimonas sp.]
MTATQWSVLPARTAPPTRFDSALHYWLANRAGTVEPRTLRTDEELLRLIPRAYLCRDLSTIGPCEMAGILDSLRTRGLAPLSVRRHRSSLSSFFTWCGHAGLQVATPALPEPAGASVTPALIRPFGAAELEAAWEEWSQFSPVLADVLLILARTGLRWSEARALTVADVDGDHLVVNKAASEGGRTRRLPLGQQRRVPLACRIHPIVERLVAGREVDELLLTTALGAQLHRTAVLRRLDWERTGRGRRLHDLRHTAAQLWLDEGVAAATVREWMGPTRLAS